MLLRDMCSLFEQSSVLEFYNNLHWIELPHSSEWVNINIFYVKTYAE